jgi:hypothetical protein
MSNDVVDDKDEGHDGLGDNEGRDIGINPSPIIVWQRMQVRNIFVTWHSDNPGSTILTIGLSLRPYGRRRPVRSSDIARDAKLSPWNSLQRPSRMYKQSIWEITGYL